MIRTVLAVLGGILVAGGLIAAGEATSHLVMPAPVGLDPSNPAAFSAAVAHMSGWPLVAVLLAWAIGSFGGATLAARVAPYARLTCAVIVGCAVMAAAVINMLTIPHPAWFWLASLLVVVPSAWLAGRMAPTPAVQ